MRSRRTDLSDSSRPGEGSVESFTGRPPQPPADALEAAAARALRVAELRRAVASGAYRPDASKVAAALFKARARRVLFGDDH